MKGEFTSFFKILVIKMNKNIDLLKISSFYYKYISTHTKKKNISGIRAFSFYDLVTKENKSIEA